MRPITEADKPGAGTKTRAIYDVLSDKDFMTPPDIAQRLGWEEHTLYSSVFTDLRKRGLIISEMSTQQRKDTGRTYWMHKRTTHMANVPPAKEPSLKQFYAPPPPNGNLQSVKQEIAGHFAAIEKILDGYAERVKVEVIEKLMDQV